MTTTTDETEYNAVWMKAPRSAVSVKKIGAGVTGSLTDFGTIAKPMIVRGSVHSDGEMRDLLLRALGPNGEVTVIGHGWLDAEKFVWRGTVTEFLQTWKGD